MDLKTFVADTLEQIISGVVDAQCKFPDAWIVPFPGGSGKEGANKVVEFDVALISQDGSQLGGGIGVFLGYVGLGGQRKEEKMDSSLTRVRFAVPIQFPDTSRGRSWRENPSPQGV